MSGKLKVKRPLLSCGLGHGGITITFNQGKLERKDCKNNFCLQQEILENMIDGLGLI